MRRPFRPIFSDFDVWQNVNLIVLQAGAEKGRYPQNMWISQNIYLIKK